MRIFISYNVKDKETATLLATLFTDRGIDVWFDKWEIKPGQSITGGIGRGIEEMRRICAAVEYSGEGSRWVDTEMRAAIRKRVDDKAFRAVPVMLDGTALPPLLADYRRFILNNISDLENIVREICPNESQMDIVARIQARFLKLVANQFPKDDVVRSLFCPVCASRGLSAHIKHEPSAPEVEDSYKRMDDA